MMCRNSPERFFRLPRECLAFEQGWQSSQSPSKNWLGRGFSRYHASLQRPAEGVRDFQLRKERVGDAFGEMDCNRSCVGVEKVAGHHQGEKEARIAINHSPRSSTSNRTTLRSLRPPAGGDPPKRARKSGCPASVAGTSFATTLRRIVMAMLSPL